MTNLILYIMRLTKRSTPRFLNYLTEPFFFFLNDRPPPEFSLFPPPALFPFWGGGGGGSSGGGLGFTVVSCPPAPPRAPATGARAPRRCGASRRCSGSSRR